MMRVLIVGAQHGNELLGERLHEYLLAHPVAGLEVEFCLANPRARKAGLRYIESDMNRSYGEGPSTYERRQAAKLARRLKAHAFDIVLDAHTTTVDQPPCIIVPYIGGDNAAFLRACHITNIVVMKHQFVRQSLIGNIPRAVSLEISNSQLTARLFKRLARDLTNYVQGSYAHAEKDVFVVEELLKKAEVTDTSSLRNFVRCIDGFYPVLVGENSYKQQTDYLGFKAKSKHKIKL